DGEVQHPQKSEEGHRYSPWAALTAGCRITRRVRERVREVAGGQTLLVYPTQVWVDHSTTKATIPSSILRKVQFDGTATRPPVRTDSASARTVARELRAE